MQSRSWERSAHQRYRPLEKARQPAAKGPCSRWFLVRAEQEPHRIRAQLHHLVIGSACRGNRLADPHPQLLAQPDLLHAGQGDWEHRHARIDGEMREAFLEGEKLAFLRSEISLREQCDRASQLQAPADVSEERWIRALGPVDWDDPAGRMDQRPERTV